MLRAPTAALAAAMVIALSTPAASQDIMPRCAEPLAPPDDCVAAAQVDRPGEGRDAVCDGAHSYTSVQCQCSGQPNEAQITDADATTIAEACAAAAAAAAVTAAAAVEPQLPSRPDPAGEQKAPMISSASSARDGNANEQEVE